MGIIYRAFLATCLAGGAGFAASADVVFTDATDEAGLAAIQWDGNTRGEFGPDMEMLFMSGGAAAGDYNNDGWCDLYVTRLFAPNLLYMNNGDGTFTEVGAAAGVDLVDRSSGCAFVDINDDGHLDLYVLTMYRWGRNYLYMNNGDGTFSEGRAMSEVSPARTPMTTSAPATASRPSSALDASRASRSATTTSTATSTAR